MTYEEKLDEALEWQKQQTEKDRRIKELEAQIEKMKCCGNCGNERCTSKYRGNSAYHTQKDGFQCADNEDWKPRS